ncbi:Uncharacterised protein [Niallia circulans]|nr:hypothetical protein [Niallia circulans]MED3840883.1 hypothetical protein [Niallia circulans]MED4241454.1 hypothetical protein [Niallia circulans]MED4248114.1 hypothetical protein [Niallia circulans]MED5103159.1 hypothetical protein [Niallia circulans]SPU11231.1 Uncharacterised protein [Niallia circulans]
MKKKWKKYKVYIIGLFYILFINALIAASYIIGFKELKKLITF